MTIQNEELVGLIFLLIPLKIANFADTKTQA